ncbi:MAG: pentapeptide repeat-containing protein, partial [Acidobacteria bacterium]|nr:pentapeptide repeat-containing protein [Acidobacteriota bacterium]
MFICAGIYYDKNNPNEGRDKSPCGHLPFYDSVGEKRYCVLHFPHDDKLEDFGDAIVQKFGNQDYDYRGIWVPEDFFFNRQRFLSKADFSYSYFNGDANFEDCTFDDQAIFDSVTFKSDAIFSHATFGQFTTFFDSVFEGIADFNSSHFGKPDIKSNATFCQSKFYSSAEFVGTTFDCEVEFSKAKFEESATFEFTTFNSTCEFQYSLFKDSVIFAGEYLEILCNNGNDNVNKVFGNESSLNIQFAIFEKPEFVAFHTVTLKPHWFVNVDSRKFEFTDIEWENIDDGQKSVKTEIEDLIHRKHQGLVSPFNLFTIACKRLASNAEENLRLEEASSFRRLAYETEWIEKKERLWTWMNQLPKESEKLKRRFSGSKEKEDELVVPVDSYGIIKRFDFLHLLYRYTSYYGESWRWALGVLLGIWLAFTFIYTQTD